MGCTITHTSITGIQTKHTCANKFISDTLDCITVGKGVYVVIKIFDGKDYKTLISHSDNDMLHVIRNSGNEKLLMRAREISIIDFHYVTQAVEYVNMLSDNN